MYTVDLTLYSGAVYSKTVPAFEQAQRSFDAVTPSGQVRLVTLRKGDKIIAEKTEPLAWT